MEALFVGILVGFVVWYISYKEREKKEVAEAAEIWPGVYRNLVRGVEEHYPEMPLWEIKKAIRIALPGVRDGLAEEMEIPDRWKRKRMAKYVASFIWYHLEGKVPLPKERT